MTDFPAYDDLPAASAWGVFGTDDNVGRLNLQTPETVVAAARLIRRGRCFPLNAPLDFFDPPLFSRQAIRRHSMALRGGRALDDYVDGLSPQASSQWDSLGHVPVEPDHFYNGASQEDVLAGRRNTIEHWARRGIAGRAVLLDMAALLDGTDYDPGDSHAFSPDDLEQAREQAGVAYRPGDVLLIHTGFLTWYARQDAATRSTIAVRRQLRAAGVEHTERMARYLWDSGAAAVASDAPTVEVWPPAEGAEDGPFGFLHRVLIGRLGFALGELWQLSDLAADCARDGTYEMFLTSAPLHLVGGIGSPANALAIK